MSFLKEWKSLTCGKFKLKIHREVYEPAEDTYLLLDNIRLKRGELVLDLGQDVEYCPFMQRIWDVP